MLRTVFCQVHANVRNAAERDFGIDPSPPPVVDAQPAGRRGLRSISFGVPGGICQVSAFLRDKFPADLL